MNDYQEPDQSKCTEPDDYFTEEFFRSIERICFNIVCAQKDIQEEVTSETLLRLCKHRYEIDFSTGRVWALAKKIAKHVFIDIDKKGKRGGSKLVEFRPADDLPETYDLPNVDYEQLVEDLLAQLSDIDKIIVQKRIEGYMTAEEIVPFLKEFGINDPSAVSKRLKKMKDLIPKLIWQGE
ncbi:hypothetical protein L0337_26225 [candidate division KSB1 bacterium]|nr:hypothetical protein [candidate division KSB1 bacterium]